MTRIHITASGKAAPCNASLRDCPRGVSNHFESMKDAVVAIRQREAEARRRPAPSGPAAVKIAHDSIPYTQQEVNELAFEELRKAGLLSEGWTIAHGHQVKALATTFYGTKQIQFSNLWTPVLTKREMLDTITHEVAHAQVGAGHGHDETWQQAHRDLGGSGEEKHHSEDSAQKDAYRERFRRSYPEGLKGGTRGGVAKKELDPAMIEALKLKYLKRFKIPFDESGLSIPELLQMAQRGELG